MDSDNLHGTLTETDQRVGQTFVTSTPVFFVFFFCLYSYKYEKNPPIGLV